MNTKKMDKKDSSRKLKVYHPPEVIIFGDAKDITSGGTCSGSGDAVYEDDTPCSSPGNSG